ncbi:MAG: DUF4175 family protein, partial [Nitrospinaceae bacterium]
PFSLDAAALLVEKKVDGLNNALINSVQLRRRLDSSDPREGRVSQAFVRELLAQTDRRIETLPRHGLVNRENLKRHGKILLGIAAVGLLLALVWPDLFARGLQNLMAAPAEAKVAVPSSPLGKAPGAGGESAADYTVETLRLAFNYPAYTRLERVVLENAEGGVRVFPGTEVQVSARINREIAGAELTLHSRDFLAITLKEKTHITGRFIAKENGHYQFQVKTLSGKKFLLPAKYPIQLEKDQPPRIILFLANPKPVYHISDKIQIFYESHDDFGIFKIDLVVEVDGRQTRKTLKTIKTADVEVKDGYTWELGAMDLEPGAVVQYYLEAFDNDNILGPNTGRSEMFSFEVFDEFKQREDLLALQEELLEKMIELLAGALVTRPHASTATANGMMQLKRLLGARGDQLIEIISLAQNILEQAKSVKSFPQPYLTLLKNIVRGFNEVREEQIQVMSQLNAAIGKATPIGLNFPPIEPVRQKLIVHLERDILLMVKVLNRERMNQVMDLNENLLTLAEKLREEFENIKNQKSAPSESQFTKALEKMRETLQKIMNQLARQVQGRPEEFLNPKAFDQLNAENLDASLERLKNLIEQGQMQEALKQLEGLMKDMELLSNQLNEMTAGQENLVDLETIRKLDEALAQVQHIEKQQRRLLDDTTAMNQGLRSKQSERFKDRLDEFFASLRKDVNAIQSILRQDETYLGTHAAMQKLETLMDEESELNQKILELNQKTLDAVGETSALQNRFRELNKSRGRLSDIVAEIQDLRLKMLHGFKTFLPQLQDQYGRLEEFTRLQDLHEFNSLFKNTYPEVYRWENQFRTARNAAEELKQRMISDLSRVSRLNSEISKKLGSMRRDLQADYRALITEKERSQLEDMAQQQGNLQNRSEGVADTFRQLNQDNPMISPQLERQMSSATRHMRHSQRHLSDQNIPEGIQAENRALRDLSELKEMLSQMKENEGSTGKPQRQRMVRLGSGQARDASRGGGSARMQKEKVNLPTEDQYHVPQQFREEILEAMKHQYPRQYQRMVSEYYKELIK